MSKNQKANPSSIMYGMAVSNEKRHHRPLARDENGAHRRCIFALHGGALQEIDHRSCFFDGMLHRAAPAACAPHRWQRHFDEGRDEAYKQKRVARHFRVVHA